MYKLLLATDEAEILSACQSVDDWALYGFRTPRIVSCTDEAKVCLEKHHADALIIALSADESQRMTSWLRQSYPLLPIVYGRADHDGIVSDLEELNHLLGQLNADNSNDRYDPVENLRHIRHAFFRTLLSGKVNGADDVIRRLSMLRSRMDPGKKCLLMRFSLPADDGYLAGRWHYGNERLETAMRNIFGSELDGMRLLVSVLDDDSIWLLACPMLDSCPVNGDDSGMEEVVLRHARNAVAHVREYLSIDMAIDSTYVLDSVTALADASVRASVGIL